MKVNQFLKHEYTVPWNLPQHIEQGKFLLSTVYSFIKLNDVCATVFKKFMIGEKSKYLFTVFTEIAL